MSLPSAAQRTKHAPGRHRSAGETTPCRGIAGPYVRIIGSPTGGQQPDVPRFDVVATPPDTSQPHERRAMMRALLEDRFKLRVHRETREMPVYVLTVAREGRLGPNLVPSKFDCQAYLAQRRAGGAAEEPADASGDSWCLFQGSMVAPAGVMILRFAGPVRLLRQRLNRTSAARPSMPQVCREPSNGT